MLGITQYVPFHYSALIGILLYFGIKLYVEKRHQSITNSIGDGLCIDCGSRIIANKCSKCDYSQE
ncbi:MAG: hypothetical protein K5781_08650 [Nitrosopumilus sp.]|nr:hypothetical protein [Nitrosopumilus sp.]